MARPLVALLLAMAALAPAAAAQAPDADFSVDPATPIAGDRATYKAELRGGMGSGNPIVAWDFNRDGLPDRSGREVGWRYGTPGEKQVTMVVVGRNGNLRATVTKTVVVAPRPPQEPPPDPEPDDDDDEPEPSPVPVPPAPTLPPVLPSGPTDSAPPEQGDDSPAELMSPFPVVRIAGVLMPWGAKVRLLSVRAPRGATVTVRCKGKSCPLSPLRRRARSGLVRIRSFERRLPAGVRLEIFVRQRDLIGKYTRLRIRAGARPLLRVDRCLEPGAQQPVRCPAA